jgi:NADPH:quinone reductase-like Zn-dependent oxidoreductase
MRAIAVSDFGSTPQLMDLPRPAPGPMDVLVRLRAAGLNPVDWKIASGALKDAEHRFPLILGVDGAGVVEDVGEDVTMFRPGDQVYGKFHRLSQGLGSYAEYGLVAENEPIAAMPNGMIFTQAAAVPTSTMTAFNMVEDARVDSGQVVLIVGATGGVGQAAVQLAANRGADIIATAAADAVAAITRLGAKETVDHRSGTPVEEQVLAAHPDGIDAIIDVVSDRTALGRLARLVRPGGTVITSVGAADSDAMAAHGVRGINLRSSSSGKLLEDIAQLIDASRIKVAIESELPIEEAPSALARNRSGGARGKTVFRI